MNNPHMHMSQLSPIRSIDVVLASEASWRSDILNQFQIPHRRARHRFDEPTVKEESETVESFVQRIALGKARSISREYASSMIIAADQLGCIGEEIFHKPNSREAAIEQLARLSGSIHRLVCGLAVIYQGKEIVSYEEATLKMRKLTPAEITFYIDREKSWDCAGSYKIESLGAALFEEIRARDTTTIIGLPGSLLVDVIRSFGFSNLMF